MTTSNPAVDLPGVRLGVVRGISYGLFGPADEFGPQTRQLGARLVRAYVYWGQVEPQPGQYRWQVVDALLDQLDADQEMWITVCSSSPWATRQPTDFLPPSPAHDLDAYGEFIRRLVRHGAGRVRYWQCDNEPSNIGLLWAGTAEEYVAQLEVMYRAVKDVDPAAAVVLGGCGYDVFSSEAGSEQRQFFDHLVAKGRDAFDLFSVHLYGDPHRIPYYVDTARQLMRGHGYLKPIIAGEHGGPVLFEFPELEPLLRQTLVSAFTEAPANQSTEELRARAARETPERRAMMALYDQMGDLPPRLRMFMAGARPALEAKRHRINCRQLVQRTVLALAEGIRRTAYWNLAPEVPGATDHFQMMHLLFGKLPLLDYEDGSLRRRHPAADTFALVADLLGDAVRVTRVDTAVAPAPTSLYTFEVERAERGPLFVLWDRRDPFDGENQPAVQVCLPWSAPAAAAIDALGNRWTIEVRDGQLRTPVSDTPILVTPAP